MVECYLSNVTSVERPTKKKPRAITEEKCYSDASSKKLEYEIQEKNNMTSACLFSINIKLALHITEQSQNIFLC